MLLAAPPETMWASRGLSSHRSICHRAAVKFWTFFPRLLTILAIVSLLTAPMVTPSAAAQMVVVPAATMADMASICTKRSGRRVGLRTPRGPVDKKIKYNRLVEILRCSIYWRGGREQHRDALLAQGTTTRRRVVESSFLGAVCCAVEVR